MSHRGKINSKKLKQLGKFALIGGISLFLPGWLSFLLIGGGPYLLWGIFSLIFGVFVSLIGAPQLALNPAPETKSIERLPCLKK